MRCGICGESRWKTIVSELVKLDDYLVPAAICFDCNLKRQGLQWVEKHHPYGRKIDFTIEVSRNEHEMLHALRRLTWSKEERAGKSVRAIERLRRDIIEIITDPERREAALSALAEYERRLKC